MWAQGRLNRKNTQKKSPGDAAGRGANGPVAAATGADEEGGATEAALEELRAAVAEGEAAGLPRQVLQAARAELADAEGAGGPLRPGRAEPQEALAGVAGRAWRGRPAGGRRR